MNYFQIGQVINTHGIAGQIKVMPFTDDIKKLSNVKEIYLDEKLTLKYIVKAISIYKNMLIMTLDGIDTIDKANKLKNEYIYIKKDETEVLDNNTYYVCDLIGCDVISALDNKVIGKIVDVFNTGANDIYEVKNEKNASIYLPAICDVIKQVDIKNKKVFIKIMEGLV